MPTIPPLNNTTTAAAADSPSKTTKPVIHINVGEIGTYAKIGQLQPTYAFNLDIATRRSAKDIARDRLYDTGFPRVTRGYDPDPEMIETARRSVSARSGSARSSTVGGAGGSTTTTYVGSGKKSPVSAASKDLARELDVISGGGGFNLSLLSSSRYYHSSQSTLNGQSEASKKSPRNSARKFIQQQTQLPYGREAFDGISDTSDSLYASDFSRRYKLNAPDRYGSSIEVLKNENRPTLKNVPLSALGTSHSAGKIITGAGVSGGKSNTNNNNSSSSTGVGGCLSSGPMPPKYLTQTPRGREQMTEIMTKGLPKRETAVIAGGYF